MGQNPSVFSLKGGQHPVEHVWWPDAVRFCNKLSEKEGIRPFYEIVIEKVQVPDWSGPGYRLPTEAEWEYACRAGSKTWTRYCYGDDEKALSEYAWYSANSGGQTHAVGERKPNAFGLYDMHGNVLEWCWDRLDANYYKRSPTDDPRGGEGGSLVIRGGSWLDDSRIARSAYRSRRRPGIAIAFGILGLRLARTPSVP